MTIKYRNPIAVVILSFVTFGIYCVYWMLSTKSEMESFGAKLPTAWLVIIPIANIYFLYKYCEAFSAYVKKDNLGIVWFLVFWVLFPMGMVFVQVELNKYASKQASA
jgi:Domain of unknown function (DUF4234)